MAPPGNAGGFLFIGLLIHSAFSGFGLEALGAFASLS